MKTNQIPQFIKPFLWSFNLGEIDLEKHRKRIITNVLNYGTKEATDWLRSFYDEQSIKAVLLKPYKGEWNKKSYNFWSVIYNINPTIFTPKTLS